MAYIDTERDSFPTFHQKELNDYMKGWNACLKSVLQQTPAADVVEVKHGYFVRNERNIPKMKEFHERGYALSMNEKSIFYTCSECGEWISLSQKYCSECGAIMDGGKNDL